MQSRRSIAECDSPADKSEWSGAGIGSFRLIGPADIVSFRIERFSEKEIEGRRRRRNEDGEQRSPTAMGFNETVDLYLRVASAMLPFSFRSAGKSKRRRCAVINAGKVSRETTMVISGREESSGSPPPPLPLCLSVFLPASLPFL